MVLRTISVGIDGSEAATNACVWAAALAKGTGASIRVLHVWQTPSVCSYPAAPSIDEAKQHARTVIRSTLETAGVSGPAESVILRGAAGPSLVAGSDDTDLLVVGRIGGDLVEYQPNFGELLGGSAARYCAHHSSVPVAAIDVGAPWTDSPVVVVGIDGSPAASAALLWAIDELPTDSTIHAVTAVSLPGAEHGIVTDFELLDPVVAEHRAGLQRLVDSLVDTPSRSNVRSVQIHVVLGYAQDGLIDPGFPYDLIVVGAHAKPGTAPGVLGSVADHTLRRATVPIVIVPAPA